MKHQLPRVILVLILALGPLAACASRDPYYYTAVVLTVVVTLAAVALLVIRALSTRVPFYWVAAAIPISVALFAFRRAGRLPSRPRPRAT
jgi:hypothetical protein